MGVELRRDEAVVERISAMFYRRDRQMPANNLQQADVPVGRPGDGRAARHRARPDLPGEAGRRFGSPGRRRRHGWRCCWRRGGFPATEAVADGAAGGEKVIYAVPGVPWEMKRMVGECVLPDLQSRAGERQVIRSRTLRTWGYSESGLAELLEPEMRRLDATGEATIAFLASGMEGLKVRITAKAADDEAAEGVLSGVESRARAVIGEAVFGADDDTMESVVLALMRSAGLTLGLGGVGDRRADRVPLDRGSPAPATCCGARWCPTTGRSRRESSARRT